MKDTIISMIITLFILSVLVMAGTSDKTAGLSFEKLDQTYGYGYGYGYGSDRTAGSTRHRDNSYTTTFSMKVVPANDGFDFDKAFPKLNKTKTNETNDIWWNDTYEEEMNWTINKTEIMEKLEEEPKNKMWIYLLGIVGLSSILLVVLRKKGDKK